MTIEKAREFMEVMGITLMWIYIIVSVTAVIVLFT